jgi:NADH:ubiquinone oxidoreductase subunit 3 (subunit A)
LILVAVAFDWGLILITAWAGASAISFALQNWVSMSGTLGTVVFLALMIVGVFWQASRRRKG